MAALMASIRSTERASRKGDASRLMALYAVAANPECTPKSISEELGLHASSVTRQIQSLEDEGYVKVTADTEDRRSCRVALTAAGGREIVRLHEIGMQRFSSFVADWDVAEVRELTRLLIKLERSKAEVNSATRKPAGARWRSKSKAGK